MAKHVRGQRERAFVLVLVLSFHKFDPNSSRMQRCVANRSCTVVILGLFRMFLVQFSVSLLDLT